MISMKGLKFSYSGGFSLEIDDLAFPDRGFVSVIGANGSGKTTLLKILSGLLKSYEGTVEVNGLELSGMEPLKLASKIAYVPVYAKPDSPVTVRELILSGSYRFGLRMNIDYFVHMCMLSDLLGRSVYEISSGEMKRALIARALIQETDIILMDEPFANLDPSYEMSVMELIREISAEKLIISAVHNVTIASVLSALIIGMKSGSITFQVCGIPSGEQLKSLYGARFISFKGFPLPDYFDS